MEYVHILEYKNTLGWTLEYIVRDQWGMESSKFQICDDMK